jgi:magnesium-transporting ATPase (P-type)
MYIIKNIWKAASTDELALIHFAKMSGMVLEGEDDNRLITIYDSLIDKRIKFKILEILEFSSHRKRMSVVALNMSTNQIFVFCKGADSVVMKLLK